MRDPYALTAPCVNCPFRREGGIRLMAERVREICAVVAPEDGRGGSFPCHKTTIEDEETGDRVVGLDSMECHGGLAFAYKVGRPSQLVRVSERIGYIPKSFIDDPDPKNIVFDSVEEMVATAVDRSPRRRRSRGRR